jgi:hypothetical protein
MQLTLVGSWVCGSPRRKAGSSTGMTAERRGKHNSRYLTCPQQKSDGMAENSCPREPVEEHIYASEQPFVDEEKKK